MYDRRFAEALDAIATNLEVAPDDPINLFLDASLRHHLGDREKALASLDRYLGRWWRIPEPTATFEDGVGALQARIEVLRRRGGRAHFPLALAHALVGQSEEALYFLAEACDHDPDWELPMVRVDPRFDAVRELPGFEELEDCFPPMRGD
jgi:tetratricopeptide (TPR) repeat protein